MLTYLLLGTNLGDRSKNLSQARGLISTISRITEESSVYETAAWGITDQPNFLNQVIVIDGIKDPRVLLSQIQEFEIEIGRIRKEKWTARLIDIDILYFGDKVIADKILNVPHPEIQNRRFTLLPLVELAPDFVHPVLQKSTQELLNQCNDQLSVSIWSK